MYNFEEILINFDGAQSPKSLQTSAYVEKVVICVCKCGFLETYEPLKNTFLNVNLTYYQPNV